MEKITILTILLVLSIAINGIFILFFEYLQKQYRKTLDEYVKRLDNIESESIKYGEKWRNDANSLMKELDRIKEDHNL